MANVLTNLLFKGSTVILDESADFPSSPEYGQFCFKGGILYIYATIDTLDTWYPLTNGNDHYVFTQGISSTSWVITHNLQTTDIIFMVYDENNVQMVPSGVEFNSDNQITLSFTESVKGRAILFGAAEAFVPAITTSQLDVGSNIQMVGTSITVSGTDIVALLDQVNSDLYSMFSWNSSLGQITFKGDLIPATNGALSIGSATRKIKDLYLSAATLHVGDNATFEGTSLAIDAGPNPTSLGDTPTIQASSLVLMPFTYNPGSGDVTVDPVLTFQNSGGEQYGISFNLSQNQFSFDSPQGEGSGSLKAQNLTVVDTITADSIQTTGTAQVKFNQDLRVDGDVTLGYDNNNTITIRGIVDLQTPITFSQAATLGDGNDTVAVNCGSANNFTIVSQHANLDDTGKLTVDSLETSGDVTVQGDLYVNGTQTVVNTTSLEVSDNEVIVNNGEAGAGVTAGEAGVSVDRGSLPNAKLIYNESIDKWQMGIEGSMVDIEDTNHNHDGRYLQTAANSGPTTDDAISLGDATHRFSNIFAVDFTGALIGNADTADKLSTVRNFTLSGDATGSASFDGTADANITVTVVDDSHIHDTRYYTEAESDERYLRRDADSVPETDITYDLGDATHRWTNVFATNFKGIADNASKLLNARTITLAGDLSGSFDFDGSGNVSADIQVINDSHTHNTQYYTQAECNANFVNASGDVMTGALQFGDSIAAQFGASLELSVSHDGTNAIINNATGNLQLQVNNGENAVVAIPNSYTTLYYDNAWRARTTSAGFEVNGLFVGQATSAQYADLAEILTCSDQTLSPGTVLKFCEVGEFDVESCQIDTARNVAGVVSENPAYLMNSDEQGVPVAYAGKVRVRVKGPVGKGQPIVSAGFGVARGILEDDELLYSFGTTIEANGSDEEKLVWCVVK